jgi:hypothetical protein
LTIESHRCHDIPASSTSRNHFIVSKQAPGKVKIGEMIRKLAVNCTSILFCTKEDGKTAAETASDEMVMGVVQT